MTVAEAKRGVSEKQGRLYEYFSSFCYDDYYFPMDGPFQNYTYFPKASLGDVRACWKKTARLIREGTAPEDIGIYIHWPYCLSRCTFCFCSMAVPRSRMEIIGQHEALHREIDAFADIFDGLPFTSLWIGGGTPTFMSAQDLDRLLSRVRSKYTFSRDAQIYLESSPATLTEEKFDVMASHGVNRITFGVQSLDSKILETVDRKGQTKESVEKAFGWAQKCGMLIDTDIMFGLEGQSRVSFVRDLVWTLKKGPDVLHVFAFDPKPQTLSKGPKTSRKDLHTLMEIADRLILGAGYRMSRLNPKTLKPDCPEERQDSAVRRHGASVLGFGPSAISHAFGSAWYCHPLMGREGGTKASGKIPSFQLMRSGRGEEMRGYALRNLSLYGRMSVPDFRERFGEGPMDVPGLSGALRDLEASGHLRVSGGAVTYTGRDPVEKNVKLKHLYSANLVEALMRGRKRVYERFVKKRNGDNGRDGLAAIRDKMEARQLFRVYFKPL